MPSHGSDKTPVPNSVQLEMNGRQTENSHVDRLSGMLSTQGSRHKDSERTHQVRSDQIEMLRAWAFNNVYRIDGIYADIASVESGTRNDQVSVQIPFGMLIRQIEYKCEEAGIAMKIVDESHTSRCSLLDNKPIERHEEYAGKR